MSGKAKRRRHKRTRATLTSKTKFAQDNQQGGSSKKHNAPINRRTKILTTRRERKEEKQLNEAIKQITQITGDTMKKRPALVLMWPRPVVTEFLTRNFNLELRRYNIEVPPKIQIENWIQGHPHEDSYIVIGREPTHILTLMDIVGEFDCGFWYCHLHNFNFQDKDNRKWYLVTMWDRPDRSYVPAIFEMNEPKELLTK